MNKNKSGKMTKLKKSGKNKLRAGNRKPENPLWKMTEEKMKMAIKGTYGNKSEIAKKLGVSYQAVDQYLKRPVHAVVLRRYHNECSKVLGLVRSNIVLGLKSRDERVRMDVTKWLAERKLYRTYGNKKFVQHSGDKANPIQTVNKNLNEMTPEQMHRIYRADPKLFFEMTGLDAKEFGVESADELIALTRSVEKVSRPYEDPEESEDEAEESESDNTDEDD